MIQKNAISQAPLNEIIAKRWSIRAFDINRKVSRDQITSLCEAARWAPSCFGDEPWRFMIFDKHHNESAYNLAFSCIGEWNQKWIFTAPVIVVALADKNFRKSGKFNRWAQYDTGSAVENMILQAVSDGLMAHPIGGFDEIKFKEVFSIPEDCTPMAFIGIGYQAEKDVIPENYHEAEEKPRMRNPLGLNFFDSQWNKPILEDIA